MHILDVVVERRPRFHLYDSKSDKKKTQVQLFEDIENDQGPLN